MFQISCHPVTIFSHHYFNLPMPFYVEQRQSSLWKSWGGSRVIARWWWVVNTASPSGVTRYPLYRGMGATARRVQYFVFLKNFKVHFGIWDLVHFRHRVCRVLLRRHIFKGVLQTIGRLYYCGCGIDSVCNIIECKEYFLERKGGPCVVLTTLLPVCVDCL
jgi:hypothetical protein